MGVVPAARGRGIGAWLIGEVVRRRRSAGETTITFNVNVDNPHAAALYRRVGFARTRPPGQVPSLIPSASGCRAGSDLVAKAVVVR